MPGELLGQQADPQDHYPDEGGAGYHLTESLHKLAKLREVKFIQSHTVLISERPSGSSCFMCRNEKHSSGVNITLLIKSATVKNEVRTHALRHTHAIRNVIFPGEIWDVQAPWVPKRAERDPWCSLHLSTSSLPPIV